MYTMTEVLSVKIDKERVKLIEKIAREEETDRSTVTRKLLEVGIKKWKMDRSIKLYSEGKVSLWKSAQMADLSLREFMDILNERKNISVRIKPEELEEEIHAMLKEKK